MQIAMSGAFAQASNASGPVDQTVFGGSGFFICTPEGAKRFSASEVLKILGDTDTDQPASPNVPHNCKWCQGFGALVLPAPIGPVGPRDESGTILIVFPDDRCLPTNSAGKGFNSRAPPA